MKNRFFKIMLFALTMAGLSSALTNCAPVKGYQKIYLNDEEMNLNSKNIEVFESNFQSYREGAVGGTNGNSGSGCGCN